MNTISKKSRKNAMKNTNRLTKIRKPHTPPGRLGQQVLEPAPAVHALEHDREAGRADQDEDHHRGQPHRRFVGGDDAACAGRESRRRACTGRRSRRRAPRCATLNGTDLNAKMPMIAATPAATRPISAMRLPAVPRLRMADRPRARCAPIEPIAPPSVGVARPMQQRAEHEEDQHAGGNDAPQALLPQRPAAQRQVAPSGSPAPSAA